MRKTVTFLGTLLIASTTFASNLECSLNILNASTGGLMPVDKSVSLNTATLQTTNSLDLKQCSNTVVSNLNIALCGYEDRAAAGVFHAEILIEEKNVTDKNGLEFTTATELLAIAKKGDKLVSLESKSGLTPLFIKKMNSAKLDFPDYQGGDSLQIDDVVSAAIKIGVLNENDIVAISVDECRLK